MGGVLSGPPGAGDAPVFVAAALRDPGAPGWPGGRLDRLQIVKVWHDGDGRFHQAVHDVARVPPGASVDPDTCALRGSGADSLCATWSDPEFDPTQKAFYYVRVLEIPTPRWTAYDAKFFGVEMPEGTAMQLQDRAYTSPIWYTP